MELRHLLYFVTCAKEKSISRAATKLRISQPGISRQLKNLENELGVELFIRGPRGLSLTCKGQLALEFAEEILSRAEQMKETLQPSRIEMGDVLRVGYISPVLSGFLAEGMRAFKEIHQDITIQIEEMTPAKQEVALKERRIDLALLGDPRDKLSKAFVIEKILRVPMAVVVPDNHLLALRKSVDLNELIGEPFVSLNEEGFPGRPKLLAEISKLAGLKIKVNIKANGLSEVMGLVAWGAGVAILPEDMKKISQPGVTFIKMSKPRHYLDSTAVWNADQPKRGLLDLVKMLKKASKKPI
jgi:DNA-binding transcriptional LysR family regulator